MHNLTMRTAIVVALALLVGTCAACGTVPPSKVAAEQAGQRALQLEQRTVALTKPGLFGPRAYCTGVWVAPDAILTANHCVRRLDVGEAVEYVTRADVGEREEIVGKVRAGALVARDEAHDLALLRDAAAPPHGMAEVSFPVVGQIAQTMGHPLGLWWSYSQGQVAAVRFKAFGDDDPMWWVQATAPISPGNSGGGLFDEDGNLIGLCDALLPAGENLNLFVHPTYIRDFLATVTK